MSTKTCTKCGVEKDVVEFDKDKTKKDGLFSWCKSCKKEYREANREKIHKYNNKYYEVNHEREISRVKEYREANHEEILVRRREAYQYNIEEIRAQTRTPEYRAKVNKRYKKRYKEDPLFRIANNLRSRVKMALKAQGAKKFTSTMDLIGCSPEFLTKHLEKQIRTGTNREDYHVDHIIPCALFDLTKEEEQRLCFHWTNLQLLLGPENMSKGDDVFWSGQVYRPDEVPSEIREEIYAHCRSNMTLRSS